MARPRNTPDQPRPKPTKALSGVKLNQEIPERELYPVAEARQLLGGLSHSCFYSAVGRGDIDLVKVGRRSFVAKSTIQRIAGGR